MSNPNKPRTTSPSDPLAASRVGVAPPASPSTATEPDDAPVLTAEPAEPPPEVKREIKRYRVLERAKVSNGQATVVLARGKVIDTVLYPPEFFEQCKKAGVRWEELPSE